MKVNIFTDKNLATYLAKGWSADKLISGKIKTLSSRTFQIQDIGADSTVLDLKRKIEDQEGIDIANQELLKGTIKLDNTKSLNHYFVVDGGTLLLQVAGEASDFLFANEDTPITNSTKVREAPRPSKVLVLDPEEAAKNPEPTTTWWENSNTSGPVAPNILYKTILSPISCFSNVSMMMPGNRGAQQPTDQQAAPHPTPQPTHQAAPQPIQEPTQAQQLAADKQKEEEEKARRLLRLKAIEKRMNAH